MLVKLRMIPHHESLNLSFDIEPEFLHNALDQKSAFLQDESFKQPAHCEVELRQKNRLDDVELCAQVSCIIEASCSRCAQSLDYNYDEQIFLLCARKREMPRRGQSPTKKTSYDSKKKKSQENEFEDSEEGLIFFSNEEIDLAEIIREHIFLNLPMRYLCEETCQGLCSRCGEKIPTNNDAHQCAKKA